MTDWTTCRVVRDRDGDLWFRIRGNMWFDGDVRIGSEGLGSKYGPLTPVLDADGLPVVRTVGDLTARHVGKRVRVDTGGIVTTGELTGVFATSARPVSLHIDDADGELWIVGPESNLTLDAHCEVLSLTEGADRPCPRCHGAGWHYYDEHHSKPCEVCCLHAVGVWQLLNHYGGRNGSWACRAGCGATWSTEDAYEAARTTPRSDADARFIAAANPAAVLALLDAAAERDAVAADADKWHRAALTLQGDRDALTDERDSLSWQVEALRAERDARSSERDALAAKVERVRALPAKHPAGGWYMTSMRDVLATLDEEPQP